MLVVEELAVEAILGLDFLERHKCAIGCEHRTIQFPKQGKMLTLSSSQEAGSKHSPTKIGLVLTQKLVLPAISESEIMASLLEKTVEDGRSWIVSREPSDRMGVLVAHALVCPANNAVPLRVLSPREEPVIVPKGTRIATLEALEWEPPDDVIQVHAVSATGNKSLSSSEEGVLWEMVSKVGSGVTESQKELFLMFSNYSDVFCLHPNDMSHTTEVKHNIDTGDSPPIHPPPRRIPHARRLEVKKLLEDMLKKDVIRPSNSPWSSPIILVQKKDGSTRFCIER